MAEKHEFVTLVQVSWGDAVVLITTFLLVVFRDLTEGILVGFGLGALLFLHRMAQAVQIDGSARHFEADVPDTERERSPYDPALATDQNVVIYRISGAFFFGAAAAVGAALDRIAEHPKAYVIDFSDVAILDSTAAATIEGFLRKARRSGAKVYITGSGAPRPACAPHAGRPAARCALQEHDRRCPRRCSCRTTYFQLIGGSPASRNPQTML